MQQVMGVEEEGHVLQRVLQAWVCPHKQLVVSVGKRLKKSMGQVTQSQHYKKLRSKSCEPNKNTEIAVPPFEVSFENLKIGLEETVRFCRHAMDAPSTSATHQRKGCFHMV
jgi:hypothetical protein